MPQRIELTPDEAASVTGYSAGHIRWLARTGKVAARRIGARVWLVDAESLAGYVRRMRELGDQKYTQ